MAQYPDPYGGSRVDADFLASMLDNWVIKAANATPRVNATLANDGDLVFPVVAGALYDVEFFIRFSALQAAGIRTLWSVPAGTTGDRECMGPGTANAVQADANTTEMKWIVFPYGTAVLYTSPRNTINNQTFLYERALLSVGATAGNVNFQWAQNVTNATGTVVHASSRVRYRRVG
jgi:hypothetical protein